MLNSISTTKLGVAALGLFTGVALCLLALAFEAPPADAATINVPCTANQLIAAIETANSNGPNPDTIELAADCTYALSSPYVIPGIIPPSGCCLSVQTRQTPTPTGTRPRGLAT